MSLISSENSTWYTRFLSNVLRSGKIPKHVATIMDGNRRYARESGLGKIIEGHKAGFKALADTLTWCRDLGIIEVTVYAFSIENFKRSDEEVDGLMNLARDKFRELLDKEDKLHEFEVSIRFFGDLSLLSEDLQTLLAKIQLRTSKHTKHLLNICLAYTSQDEITRSMQHCVDGVTSGLISAEEIDEDLVESCLDTGIAGSYPVDLLIRTSGELRFSDFMLWQTSHSVLYFDNVLWPQFDFWRLFKAIIYYQLNSDKLNRSPAVTSTESNPVLDQAREEQQVWLELASH